MPTLDSAAFRVRAAILLVFLGAACGRTGLDEPVDVTISGSGGTSAIGTAGTSGAAGVVGTAGTGVTNTGIAGNFGFAGTTGIFGAAGTTGAAGIFGAAGTTGAAGIFGAAGTRGSRGVPCIEGSTLCSGPMNVVKCKGGIFTDFSFCPNGCSQGACVECMDGDTRCASNTTVQICKGGQWADFEDCAFVCGDNACGTNPKRVFVTSQTFEGGALGGLDGADAICNKLALAAGISGDFRAWLSDSEGSPVTRFAQDGGPYVLLNGDIVANNWNELTSGVARVPIEISEIRDTPPGATGGCPGPAVWSDTEPTGEIVNADLSCGDWSDPGGTAALWGTASSRDNWSDDCSNFDVNPSLACGSRAALFCFEQ